MFFSTFWLFYSLSTQTRKWIGEVDKTFFKKKIYSDFAIIFFIYIYLAFDPSGAVKRVDYIVASGHFRNSNSI
jgi:hypothetical protein